MCLFKNNLHKIPEDGLYVRILDEYKGTHCAVVTVLKDIV